MVALADIGPLTKQVPFRGVELEVKGLTAFDIFGLLEEYPELKKLMTGKNIDGDVIQILINGFPGTIGSIIAAAVGQPGDTATRAAAMAMTAGEQALFIGPILDLTFPQGLKSFIDGLTNVAKAAVPGASGWGQATKSPAPSNSASPTGTPALGTTHPDSSTAGHNSSDASKSDETSTSSTSSETRGPT